MSATTARHLLNLMTGLGQWEARIHREAADTMLAARDATDESHDLLLTRAIALTECAAEVRQIMHESTGGYALTLF